MSFRDKHGSGGRRKKSGRGQARTEVGGGTVDHEAGIRASEGPSWPRFIFGDGELSSDEEMQAIYISSTKTKENE